MTIAPKIKAQLPKINFTQVKLQQQFVDEVLQT